jgi:putative membrane-bound dehydrogenase-like protein
LNFEFSIMTTKLVLLLATSSVGAAEFPAVYNSETNGAGPMPAAEAAAKMQLPAGFKATLFAAEPDVQNPIAMAWDARGRLWVAENYTYAESAKHYDLNLRDRVLIFEDKDGDGRFDSRKVFTDELQMLTSVEIGYGGVWALCPPRLIFIPDKDRDDVPDAAPEVLVDGFTPSPDMYHTFANGLRFGPDGWLYGRCGASSAGEIGIPGTPAEQRIPLRGTMWRYHPQRKVVEVIGSGTTNPWGHDWNEHGELFFINTVNGHLWHEFAGAHFMRPHTFDPNPRAYALIDQHADHWHFDTASGWQKSRDGMANDLGGGHAHIGMMIYEGDNWPEEYRGHLFTLNLHGRRLNQEILERAGSGYVGKHGADFMLASDPWFRGMEVSYGPDGGVFVLDWSDTGECHDYTGVHRTSGRIFKITYGKPKRSAIEDVRSLSAVELAKLHTHGNEWFSRQARLELIARTRDGRYLGDGPEELLDLFKDHDDPVVKLRALWTLYAIGAIDQKFLRTQLHHPNEHVRAWAVRLLTDDWPLDTVLSKRPAGRPEAAAAADFYWGFVTGAQTERSGLVRLAYASALQRLPVSNRVELADGLLEHRDDANDHNLPLMIWYGLIPAAETQPSEVAELLNNAKIPLTRKLIARRLAEDVEKNPAAVNHMLQIATAIISPSLRADVVNGMTEGLVGWRKARKPAAWDAFITNFVNSPDAALRERVRDLSVLFGDGRALDEVKNVATDKEADLTARKVALQTLIDSHAPDLRPVCEQLLSEQFINPIAARGLATFDDPAVGAKMVGAYRQFHASERGQLLSALVSRASFASALLDAVANKKIPRGDITAFHARQIRSLNDAELNKKLAATWGELRDSSQDKRKGIADWKTKLPPATLARANLSQGRVVFNTACAVCHTLYGEGGKIGPDLTGGGRENIDYLLENIVDPSSVVTADFRMTVVELKDGRLLNAIVTSKTDRTVTLKTMTEAMTTPREEVVAMRESADSLMPEGLLEALTGDQARDLIAYLMHKTQVPLPSAAAGNSH